MKKNNYLTLVTLMNLYLFGAASADGATEEDAPNLKEWVASLDKSEMAALTAPQTVTVVKAFADDNTKTGVPDYDKTDSEALSRSCYMSAVKGFDVEYSRLLNDPKAGLGIAGALRLSGADTLFFSFKDRLFMRPASLKKNMKIELPADEVIGQDPAKWCHRVLSSLGYDGVVLAAKNSYLLVGSSENRLKAGSIQGLVIAGSESRWGIV